MNNIKRHFFLILPLVALLFALESILLINRAIITKESRLSQNYSIVIASKENLTYELISKNIKDAKSLELIDANFVLDKIRANLDEEDFKNIKKELPLYYTLRLNNFPTLEELKKIDSTLLKIPGIIKVESFSKVHNQAFKLLIFIKLMIHLFSAIIVLISVLLMFGQIRIWHFEHNKRVIIMSYLGASSWMKNQFLIKSAFVDSLISVIVVMGFVVYLANSAFGDNLIQALGAENDIFRFSFDFLALLCASLVVSLGSAFIAILFQKRA